MHSVRQRISGLGVALLIGCGVVSATDTDARAADIRLVTGDAFPPFSDRDYEGGGIITEIVRRSFEQAGYDNVEIIWRSWLKGFEMTVEGSVGGTFPYSFTRARSKTVLFSDPITNLTAYGWFANAREEFYENLDLVGKSLCLPLGYAELGNTGQMFSTGQASRVSPPDMKTCFKLLSVGRVDAVVSPIPEAMSSITAAGLSSEDFDHIEEGLSDMPLHFVVGKNHPDAEKIIDAFNAALRQLRDNGELERILGQATY